MAEPLWKVKIDFSRFNRNLNSNMAGAQQRLDIASGKMAARFEAHLRRNTPHLDGDLVASIQTQAVTDGYSVTIGDAAHPYAAAVEFGHTLKGRHIPGQRFWLPLVKIYNKRWRGTLRREMRAVFKGFK